TPIAKAVSSTENVDYVTGSRAQGVSSIQGRMRLGRDSEKAPPEVISKTQQVRRFLPSDAEDSIITKGTGRSFALMYLAFASSKMKSEQITEYLARVIQPRMSTIPGVADAQILGARNFAMRIWLDPVRMASHTVTAKDIADAVNDNNFLSSPGSTKSQLVAVAIDSDTTLKT